ncbi:hypothetical protein [Longimicrobium terrae]|uniref:Uncharacterized protein n=1 Tax=Longimicrobium terrae TaxID=1639882 RepID=A0A841GYP7_9BACT|nr:hypothetical protein [Longimicrobium terrae]MBB4636561.1 hypothetical protein [Longimicrobium terrae]MBB6070915.1 hypothetical protein [Longimicrobium terrae]NNC28938.1 hypothetical protein [Longimicrobium terrae]
MSDAEGEGRMAEIHARLLGLCARALDAALPYAEISAAFPPPFLDGVPFYDDVLTDLRYAVQHVPGRGFSREIDYGEWYASEMHHMLYLDIQLMRSGLSAAEMSRIRDPLIEDPRFTPEMADARVAKAVAAAS